MIPEHKKGLECPKMLLSYTPKGINQPLSPMFPSPF